MESEWRGVKGVVILVGTNDIKSLSPEQFRVKYRVLVKIVRARLGPVNIVLLGIPPRPRDHATHGHKAIVFNSVIREIAIELGVLHHPLYKACLSHGQPIAKFFHGDVWNTVCALSIKKIIIIFLNNFLF